MTEQGIEVIRSKLTNDIFQDERSRFPAVAECCKAWNRLRDEVDSYYKDRPRERLPLSRQKEFRSVRNAVIHEAERIRLGAITFEDEQMAVLLVALVFWHSLTTLLSSLGILL